MVTKLFATRKRIVTHGLRNAVTHALRPLDTGIYSFKEGRGVGKQKTFRSYTFLETVADDFQRCTDKTKIRYFLYRFGLYACTAGRGTFRVNFMFAIDTLFEYERSDLRLYIIACRLTCKRGTYHLVKIIARAVQKRYRIYTERGESFGRQPSPERRLVLRPKTFAPVFHFLLFLPLHKYTCILVRARTHTHTLTHVRKSTLIFFFFFDNTICVPFISKNIVGSRLKCLF